jgi:zinc protease
MAQLYMFDLPLDYYETLPARVNAITTADVAAVAKKYLTPERMVVVAVGDRKAIEPQLQKLNLGNIVIRDADGNEVMASNN